MSPEQIVSELKRWASEEVVDVQHTLELTDNENDRSWLQGRLEAFREILDLAELARRPQPVRS